MKKLWELFKAANPTVRIIYAVAVAVLVGLLIWLTSAAVYRLFFQGQDLKKEHATNITNGEVAKGTEHTTDAAINAVAQRGTDQQTVRVIVSEGRNRVNESWHGETVGDDVDRAGADALCRVHDTLCRGPAPAPLQPVR